MKVAHVTLSLQELQEALVDFCAKKGLSQPDLISIQSYDKVRITVDPAPGGFVEADAFRHRAWDHA